jgi:hypothetical protein
VADVLLAAAGLDELRMPDVSLADASAEPALAPLRRFDLRRFGRTILDVPVDEATRRRWARAWVLRRVQVYVLVPLSVVALVLFVAYFAVDFLPFNAGILAIPLVLANGVAAWMMQRPARPLAQVTRDGDVVVTGVDPRAAARWMAANPKGAVSIL